MHSNIIYMFVFHLEKVVGKIRLVSEIEMKFWSLKSVRYFQEIAFLG